MADTAPAGWVEDSTDERLLGLWPNADTYGPDLDFPLRVALIQCRAFAPALAQGAPVPENYVAGQILQARAIVRAGLVGDGSGSVEQTVSLFPMDWQVKNLLRPRKGKPYLGRRAER